MFFDEASIRNLLKCKLCNSNFFDQPRILPCGKTVCENCIIDIEHSNNQKFKCSLCFKDHEIPKDGFILNELAFEMISIQPDEVSRSQICEQFKNELKNLDKLIHELNFNSENGADIINQHCFEQRRLIQLSTETKIQEINKIEEINKLNEIFIDEVDNYEKKCINSYRNKEKSFRKIVNNLIDEANSFLNKMQLYLKEYQINDAYITSYILISDSFKSKLKDELENIKFITFGNDLICFYPDQTTGDVIFGSLEYKKQALYPTLKVIFSIFEFS
jgi:hypothetical protein